MDFAGRTNFWAHSIPRYNSIGFFFWGYVKEKAFRPKFGSVIEVRTRINNAVASLTLQKLENTWHEIQYRLGILRATNGAQIEVKLGEFFPAERTSSLYLVHCVSCVLEVWGINYGHHVRVC
jgi:hypothetical protein